MSILPGRPCRFKLVNFDISGNKAKGLGADSMGANASSRIRIYFFLSASDKRDSVVRKHVLVTCLINLYWLCVPYLTDLCKLLRFLAVDYLIPLHHLLELLNTEGGGGLVLNSEIFLTRWLNDTLWHYSKCWVHSRFSPSPCTEWQWIPKPQPMPTAATYASSGQNLSLYQHRIFYSEWI